MKKLVLILAVAVVATTSLTSCKKDYNCTCTDPFAGTTIIPINNAKKDDANTICDTQNAFYALLGGSCSLD
ncbi:MAG: hypothetical protein LH473_01730 [Chitinophagales bacterium]|nr:hypothetical protein [Chitinophagales bacterium]